MHLLRSLVRACALCVAATALAACGDSISPLSLEPEEFESLGESIAFEIERSAMQFTPDGALGLVESPAFSLGSDPSREVLESPAFNLIPGATPSRQMLDEDCGVPSQDPPVDTDGDGVPDNWWVTFSLPGCRIIVEETTMDITGVLRISDPTPGTSGMALTVGLDNFRVAFDHPDFSGYVDRDGSASVAVSETGLSQVQKWDQTIRVDGFPQIWASIDWTATFAAAAEQTITAGEPLPDGTFVPGGTFVYREGKRQAAFAVTTTEPLEFNASCAADVAEGFASSPFTGGQVRVAFSTQQAEGFVQITYEECGFALVQFVTAN